MNISRRTWMTVGVGLAAAAAGAGFAWSGRHTAPPARPADPSLWQASFPSAGGGAPWKMGAFKGKPLVINFWATWCAPCIKELPQFERFHREYSSRGVQVVGLAIDGEPAVRDFLRRTPVSYPIGLAGLDGSELMIALGNGHGALPFTVVIDSEGTVQQAHLGETGFDDLVRWTRKNP